MAYVYIKSIGKQNILTDSDFNYVKSNLNKPLQLNSIDWFDTGMVCSISFFCPNHIRKIVVLFPDSNELEYEVTL